MGANSKYELLSRGQCIINVEMRYMRGHISLSVLKNVASITRYV